MVRDLYRDYRTAGTFGILELDLGPVFIVERPWLENEPADPEDRLVGSCIPEGLYDVEPCHYNRGGYPALEVLAVDGRTLIKIHKANLPHEVLGCLAPNLHLGFKADGRMQGITSSTAFARVMEELGLGFKLRVTSHSGPPVVTDEWREACRRAIEMSLAA